VRRKTRTLAAATVLIAVTAAGGVVAMSSAKQATPAAQDPPANTVKVEKGKLSAMVYLDGTLTYRARSDGSLYVAINQARGTYTQLPENGDKVDCGDVLYRVDDHPVFLLCGEVPAYRDLHSRERGKDVRQLNRNLHQLGYDATAGVHINPDGKGFTRKTKKALKVLQDDHGLDVTGALDTDGAVFLPDSVRIAKVTGQLGGSARPGTPVAKAMSDTLEVRVDLDASQQGEVKKGDRAQITLPGYRVVLGKVDRFGRVAQTTGKDQDARAATIPAFLSLDDPTKARGLDRAPVQVEVATAGVENALSVPVTAIIGRSCGGFAVEVVRAGGRRELVAAQLGLVDTAAGRVQVEGDLHEGDDVVVPSL
jgi:Putative peptidoglycan binding domain